MDNNATQSQLSQFAYRLDILENRVSYQSNPIRYAQLGGDIMECIYSLRKSYPHSQIIQYFKNLYTNWEKQNVIFSASGIKRNYKLHQHHKKISKP